MFYKKLSTVINHHDGWERSRPSSRFHGLKQLTVLWIAILHCKSKKNKNKKKKNECIVNFLDWPDKESLEVLQVCPSHAAKATLFFSLICPAMLEGALSYWLYLRVSVSLQFSGGFRRSLRFLMHALVSTFQASRDESWCFRARNPVCCPEDATYAFIVRKVTWSFEIKYCSFNFMSCHGLWYTCRCSLYTWFNAKLNLAHIQKQFRSF